MKLKGEVKNFFYLLSVIIALTTLFLAVSFIIVYPLYALSKYSRNYYTIFSVGVISLFLLFVIFKKVKSVYLKYKKISLLTLHVFTYFIFPLFVIFFVIISEGVILSVVYYKAGVVLMSLITPVTILMYLAFVFLLKFPFSKMREYLKNNEVKM